MKYSWLKIRALMKSGKRMFAFMARDIYHGENRIFMQSSTPPVGSLGPIRLPQPMIKAESWAWG
jgi:hypothetical protein